MTRPFSRIRSTTSARLLPVRPRWTVVLPEVCWAIGPVISSTPWGLWGLWGWGMVVLRASTRTVLAKRGIAFLSPAGTPWRRSALAGHKAPDNDRDRHHRGGLQEPA